LGFSFLLWATLALAAADFSQFAGAASTWREGFARYDFEMDEATLEITPFKRDKDEKFAVANPAPGKRRCVVVAPKKAAPGNPWSWQGCYWDHEPQTEVELLRRGYHIAFISPEVGREWDAFYAWLTEKHGLAKRPSFVGMSKGGANAYEWATKNPTKVSCIYADNPAILPGAFERLEALETNDVALLNIVGSLDLFLQRHTLRIEERYQQLGGRITLMIKEGVPHHPHSLRNPTFIADWIADHSQVHPEPIPPFINITNYIKSYYYSFDSTNIVLPEEKTYATCRGPGFTACYERYDAIDAQSRWGVTGLSIIVPKQTAPGKPWVFRGNAIQRESVVDQALLARGFHIMTAPLLKHKGAVQTEWNETYQFMTNHGFAAKPVMIGSGAGAGEAYAWAIANPGKVACIYTRNAMMRSATVKGTLLDDLAPLARARVPLLHVADHNDPLIDSDTREAEMRYTKLGGSIKVIIHQRDGRYPLPRADRNRVLDFILTNAGRPSDAADGGPAAGAITK
jgi:pimeloyl-ACP methyl ester carboxylesterase